MLKLVVPDVDMCTGCRTCQMVCSLSHEGECNPRLARLQVYRDRHKGVDIPIICQHCENAPCKAVCPTHAITKNLQSGVVLVNQDLCIGCGMCVQACPFGMIVLSPKTHKSMKCSG
jgi:Fe-S-cluster-containing hydrogenase component 2